MPAGKLEPHQSRHIAKEFSVKKALALPLTDKELQDLYRILIDRDKDAALEFLQTHARKPLHQVLEGG
jgi:hypothetical protein